VQTTLLGLAIAAILALVTALVGPAFVDWGQYRARFEAEASRMADQPVRIAGAIDVRLLPTPKIMLRDIEVGPRAAPVFGAQAVRAELSLESLMRGEPRASALTLTGPEIGLALDRNGQVAARLRTLGFDAERIAIDRLVIEDGRITLEDAASGSRVTLDKLAFDGDVRGQTSQIKGEGEFAANGQPFRYRIATSRREAGTRVRITLEPADRPLAFETEGNLTFEKDSPVFEGTASVARPAGVVLDSGRTVANEPWRISGKVKADARHVLFEQVEAQYGPDERRLRLGGAGEFRFGAQPRLEGVLSARQLDLDRALAAANATSRLPLSVLAGLVDALGDAARPPFALSFGIGIDTVTLGGASVQSLRTDIKSVDGAWSVDTFEFRAPGATQVQFSGRLGGAQNAGAIAGPLLIDSADPSVLMAWLEGAERPRDKLGALRLRSDVDVGRERVAFERVSAEIDRKAFEGRFAYTYPAGNTRAKLDVALNAAEFDIEAAYSFVKTAMAGSKLERPGEVALAVDLGRTSFAGVTATGAKANLRYDSGGVRIERLAVGDFGGAALSASGQIDIASAQPAGNISLNLTAPKIDGVAAALEKILPGSGETMLRHAAQLSPARIDASLSLDPPPQASSSAGKPATGKFSLDGRLGNIRLVLSGQAVGVVAELEKANLRLEARVASEDGVLMSVLGLDRFAPAARRATNLTVAANGALNGDMKVDARIASEGFDLSGAGTLKFADWTPSGALNVSLSSADIVALRRAGSPAFPVALKSNLSVAGGALNFTTLDGKAGSAGVKGQLAFKVAPKQPWNVDGRISTETLDVPSLLAAVLGAPPAAVASAQATAWPQQPFTPTFYSGLRGRVEFDAARATIMPSVDAQKLQGAVKFGQSEIVFDQVTAIVGGGKASANAKFEIGPSGMTLRGNATLAPADAAAVIRAGAQTPVAGKLSGELVFESTGSSLAALVAGLRGGGLVSLDNGKIAGLDIKAIDAAARAAERGPAPTPQLVTDIVTKALDAGTLSIPTSSAPVELVNGRARLGKLVTPDASDVTLSGGLDFVEEAVDLRFTLVGSGAPDAQGLRPELVVLYKGPVSAPRRTVDVSALTSWLMLQSVERESRKLEAEEREAKRREALDALIREATRDPAPLATGATPPATGLFAPELPAPQLIPANPRPATTSAAPSPHAAALATPALATPAPPLATSVPASEFVAPNPGALPLNPPLPQRRPSASAQGPVELAPPARRGSRIERAPLFSPQ
jgi:large subunit ribosomal protein L24